MLIPMVLVAVCLLIAIFLLSGRGGWLIAGYNAMTPEEKAQWNKKALCRAVGVYMLMVAVMTFFMALWDEITWMPWVYVGVILAGTAVLMVFVNRSPRFRNKP